MKYPFNLDVSLFTVTVVPPTCALAKVAFYLNVTLLLKLLKKTEVYRPRKSISFQLNVNQFTMNLKNCAAELKLETINREFDETSSQRL